MKVSSLVSTRRSLLALKKRIKNNHFLSVGVVRQVLTTLPLSSPFLFPSFPFSSYFKLFTQGKVMTKQKKQKKIKLDFFCHYFLIS